MSVSVQDSTARVGRGGWWERRGMVPGPVGKQELNFSSSERERLVRYPVEIPTSVLPPKKDPET